MWYKLASVETAIENLADNLISNKIRRVFVDRQYRFPTPQEEDVMKKRVYTHIRENFKSIYNLRRNHREQKIKELIDEALKSFVF